MLSSRDKELLAKFYEDFYEGEEDYTGGNVMLEIEGEDKELDQNDCVEEFTTDEIQDAIDRLKKKKGKAKDSNGIRAEKLKNCSDETKEKSGQFSTKLHSRKTSHQKAGEKTEYK